MEAATVTSRKARRRALKAAKRARRASGGGAATEDHSHGTDKSDKSEKASEDGVAVSGRTGRSGGGGGGAGRGGGEGKKRRRSWPRRGDPLREAREGLPIWPFRERIVAAVRRSRAVVIVGETGSGKTTQIPQFLADAGMTRSGMLAVTQPRRVAAITVAQRVADEMGCELGEQVGYTIRFDDRTSASTRVKFATDGMLLREAQLDPLLKRYSVIMLDEAHERTLSTDVLFAVIKRAMEEREDLRVVVMSATLNVKLFSEYFGAEALTIPGRQHPVTMYYLATSESDYIDGALAAILQLHVDEPGTGGVLVFLPGQEDIESLAKILERKAEHVPEGTPGLKVCQLYAALPPAAQLEAFAPAPKGTRKVLLATNIAETSVTINGIRYVIDPGLVKERTYSSATGMEILAPVPVSRAQAWQRAGRAGREAPGKCFRLYTEDAFLDLKANPTAEVQRTSLASVALRLKAMKAPPLQIFPFLEPPSKMAIRKALEELVLYEALDNKGNLTTRGSRMAALPVEPRYALLLLKSEEIGCCEEMLSLVAMLSVDGVFFTPVDKRAEATRARRRFVSAHGDHLTLLNVVNAYLENGQDAEWCHDHFINVRSVRKALEIRDQLRGICEFLGVRIESCGSDPEPVLRCLVAGCFLNVAMRQPGARKQSRPAYKTTAGGQEVSVHPMSVLFGRNPAPKTLVYNEVVTTTKTYMRCVSSVAMDWLAELAPQVFSSVTLSGNVDDTAVSR